jgi:hypothetical protein
VTYSSRSYDTRRLRRGLSLGSSEPAVRTDPPADDETEPRPGHTCAYTGPTRDSGRLAVRRPTVMARCGRVLGLVIGFAGMGVLVWGKTSLRPGGGGLAVAAALAATLCYGVAASYTNGR